MPALTITIMRPCEAADVREVDLPERPDYSTLKAIIRPLLDGADMEHVTVLHNGQRTDMFVDELSAVKGLDLNDEATRIYRANWLAQRPSTDPSSLPAIYGPAVLFSRRVWF